MARSSNIIRRYMSISAVIDMLRKQELTLLDPETWDDRNDSYYMALHKKRRGAGGLYAACAATCSETYHHWRVFTAKGEGACVEILRDPLEAALDQLPNVRFGKVEYLTLDEIEQLPSNLFDLPFLKRYAFGAEEEYRIVIETAAAQMPAIGLKFPLSFINRILLNPWLPEPVAKSVIETLKEIDGRSNLKIVRSHLVENARWKRAGDKMSS